MKAISVRQPWAKLIIQNEKTVEIRKLHTNYRGPLLIHAAVIVGKTEFIKANVDPNSREMYEQKAIIGIVDLKDVLSLTAALWEELREKHLLPGKWSRDEYKYAWILENPRPIKPIPYIGLPAIFSVKENVATQILKSL